MNKRMITAALLLAAMLFACGCGAYTTPVEEPVEETEAPAPEIVIVTPEQEIAAETGSEPESTPEATPEPEPEATPEPTPTVVITITKDPTGETIFAGGLCSFIAHADNGTIKSWIFIDKDKKEYTPTEAAAQNSGLVISGAGSDQIVLSSVPASLNGWSVLARYENGDVTKDSGAALITVYSYEELYESVFQNYRDIAKTGSTKDEFGLSSGAELSKDAELGYCLVDVDGNGICELLVGLREGDDMPKVVRSMFTLVNYKPQLVFVSWARSRYTYAGGNKFVYQGSGGATESSDYIYEYSDGKLSVAEGIYTADDGTGNVGYYSVTGGDRNTGTSTAITEEEYASKAAEHAALEQSLPTLTKIWIF